MSSTASNHVMWHSLTNICTHIHMHGHRCTHSHKQGHMQPPPTHKYTHTHKHRVHSINMVLEMKLIGLNRLLHWLVIISPCPHPEIQFHVHINFYLGCLDTIEHAVQHSVGHKGGAILLCCCISPWKSFTLTISWHTYYNGYDMMV